MPSVYLSTTDRGVYYLPSPPLSRDTNLVPGYLSKIWAPSSRGHVRLSFDADSFLLCCCFCCLFIAFFFWTSHQTNNFTIRFYVIGAFRTEKISTNRIQKTFALLAKRRDSSAAIFFQYFLFGYLPITQIKRKNVRV